RTVLCFRSRFCVPDKPHVFVTCSFGLDPLLGQVLSCNSRELDLVLQQQPFCSNVVFY
ncbi:unnamed protein product, partial [Sphagnum compactum]